MPVMDVLPFSDRIVMFIMTVVLIIGGYQFYFFCQRHPLRASVELESPVDGWISYSPHWVWIYSGAYYPMMIAAALSMPSWRELGYVVLSYFMVLMCQMFFFLLFPVATPAHWRNEERVGWSEWFLGIVQGYDQRSNSFPSMHVSVATITELHLARINPEIFWPWGLLFPLAIGVSALKTKQHFVTDILAGALLGALVYHVWGTWVYPLGG
ncbi:MAG: hypothetical protein Alpg2KO_27020 [Alphaproteobacteria bacterium]